MHEVWSHARNEMDAVKDKRRIQGRTLQDMWEAGEKPKRTHANAGEFGISAPCIESTQRSTQPDRAVKLGLEMAVKLGLEVQHL